MIDKFREEDPRWQPRADSVETALVGDTLHDFIRCYHPASTPSRPRPSLPPGVYLQLQGDGNWALFVPCGSAGYRRVDGTYEELVAVAQSFTTEN